MCKEESKIFPLIFRTENRFMSVFMKVFKRRGVGLLRLVTKRKAIRTTRRRLLRKRTVIDYRRQRKKKLFAGLVLVRKE